MPPIGSLRYQDITYSMIFLQSVYNWTGVQNHGSFIDIESSLPLQSISEDIVPVFRNVIKPEKPSGQSLRKLWNG
ncbi:MAG TPA: hypothetical protein VFS84_09350 [Candidatus Binatia bacterium]|jgi:hypothetical protein|nr:hypothetical protein [Candidatus Binatia bacterium]